MATLTLNIELSESTLRKLRSYAMLSGIPIEDLEQELSNMTAKMVTDQVEGELTRRLLETLAQMDNRPVGTYLPDAPKPDEPVAAAAEPADHQLSDEQEDEQAGKSLEEQVTPAKKATPKQPAGEQTEDDMQFDIDAPDVGENSEAFVDAAMPTERPAAAAQANGIYGPMTRATKKFSEPRVRISEYDENEAGLFS